MQRRHSGQSARHQPHWEPQAVSEQDGGPFGEMAEAKDAQGTGENSQGQSKATASGTEKKVTEKVRWEGSRGLHPLEEQALGTRRLGALSSQRPSGHRARGTEEARTPAGTHWLASPPHRRGKRHPLCGRGAAAAAGRWARPTVLARAPRAARGHPEASALRQTADLETVAGRNWCVRRRPGTEPAAVQGPQRAWGHQKAENQETGGSGQQHGQDRPQGGG